MVTVLMRLYEKSADIEHICWSICWQLPNSSVPKCRGKGKAIPLQACTGPDCSRSLRIPENRHMKVVRLSALRTGPPLPPGNIPGSLSVRGWVDPRGHSAAGRIMSMKNSNDTIGNRTHDLPSCSAVPQPTAPPRAPNYDTVFHFSNHRPLYQSKM